MAYALVRRSKRSGPPVRKRAARRAGPAGHARRLTDLPRPQAATSAPTPIVQTKLEVAPPNDQFEQEAERVADQVVHMGDPQGAGSSEIAGVASPNGVQRLCAECEDEVRRQPVGDEEEDLQMKRASGATPEIGPGVRAEMTCLPPARPWSEGGSEQRRFRPLLRGSGRRRAVFEQPRGTCV